MDSGQQKTLTAHIIFGPICTAQVFKLDLANLVFTLHGHYGPITSNFIDYYQSCTGGSGSQDGLLCVWDLVTGACMYSIQAHDGAIVSLICSPSYVISMGTDERLYIWERFQGNLLNTINLSYVYTSLLMLTPSLLITAKPGMSAIHVGKHQTRQYFTIF